MDRKQKEMEIFNSMPHNTLEECIAVINEINKFRDAYKEYDKMISQCNKSINFYVNKIKNTTERIAKFEEFSNSKVCQLIKQFINKGGISLEDIEIEIEKSGDQFMISISKDTGYSFLRYEAKLKANEESVFSGKPFFYIESIGCFWNFDEENIDEKMQEYKEHIPYYKESIERISKRKEEIESEEIDTKWSITEDNHRYDYYWKYDGETIAEFYDNGEEDYYN